MCIVRYAFLLLPTMVLRCFMEVGWVTYVSFGPPIGKLVGIVNVTAQNSTLAMDFALR